MTNIKVVAFGSLGLILLMSMLSIIPSDNIGSRLLIGLLVVIFGAFFVTVSSRIVGLIGSLIILSAYDDGTTIMSTCHQLFIGIGWTGSALRTHGAGGRRYDLLAAAMPAPLPDLKTGYIVGCHSRNQQLHYSLVQLFRLLLLAGQ